MIFQSSASQIFASAVSFAAGVILCLVYDVFRTLRIIKHPKKIMAFIQDIAYALIAALVTFIMQLSLVHGEIRWFILLFEGLGFISCRKTVSKPLIFIFTKIIKTIKRMLRWVTKTIILPIRKFSMFLYRKIKIRVKYFRIKVFILIKKRLQKVRGVLYNNFGKKNKKIKERKIVETTKQLF